MLKQASHTNMTQLIKLICVAAALSLLTGCVTTGSNPPINPAVASAVVETAAAIGTQYDLSPPPGGAGRTQDRPYFQAADLGLQTLSTNSAVSYKEVSELLKELNANPAYSGLAGMALTDALSVIQDYASQNTNVVSIQPYVIALDSGIQAGLAATEPANTNQVRSVKFLKHNK